MISQLHWEHRYVRAYYFRRLFFTESLKSLRGEGAINTSTHTFYYGHTGFRQCPIRSYQIQNTFSHNISRDLYTYVSVSVRPKSQLMKTNRHISLVIGCDDDVNQCAYKSILKQKYHIQLCVNACNKFRLSFVRNEEYCGWCMLLVQNDSRDTGPPMSFQSLFNIHASLSLKRKQFRR